MQFEVWTEEDEAKNIAARNALGISAEDEARLLSEENEMEDKEKTADQTVAQPTVCPPHTRVKLVNGVWTCSRCEEPVNVRKTRTFSSY